MPSNEVSLTVDFKNVKLVQEIIKKFTDEATRLEERNGILYSHIELLNKALDVLCPLVARTIDFLPSEQFTLIAATREALDNVTYIQNKEYRENTNQDYYKQELARRDEKIAELLKVYGECKDAIARRDEELALTEKKLCNIDRSARVEVARRDEIIARLKEDAERLADIADMFGDDAIAVLKHRALMKELEK